MFRLAHRYQVQHIIDYSARFLADSVTPGNALEVAIIAEQHLHDDMTKDVCNDMLREALRVRMSELLIQYYIIWIFVLVYR